MAVITADTEEGPKWIVLWNWQAVYVPAPKGNNWEPDTRSE